jgi:hypothetical protein
VPRASRRRETGIHFRHHALSDRASRHDRLLDSTFILTQMAARPERAFTPAELRAVFVDV